MEEGNVKAVGLECVTKIGDTYVSFKDIFKVEAKAISNVNSEIKDHVDLFLSILKSPSQSVIYE